MTGKPQVRGHQQQFRGIVMRRALALCLMICLSVIPALPGSRDMIPEQNDVQKESPKELKRQAALREKLERMGSGAQVRVAMRGSSPPVTMQGTIDEIAPETFALKTKDGITRLQYRQIEKVSLTKGGYYRSSEATDPVRVRQVLADMGIGENVKIKLNSGDRLTGKIQTIDENSVTLMEAKTGQSRVVAFSEIKELNKKTFPTWGKAVIIVGVAVGLLAGLMYAACGSHGCH